jgi:hypothetical protein
MAEQKHCLKCGQKRLFEREKQNTAVSGGTPSAAVRGYAEK